MRPQLPPLLSPSPSHLLLRRESGVVEKLLNKRCGGTGGRGGGSGLARWR